MARMRQRVSLLWNKNASLSLVRGPVSSSKKNDKKNISRWRHLVLVMLCTLRTQSHIHVAGSYGGWVVLEAELIRFISRQLRDVFEDMCIDDSSNKLTCLRP